jgi:diguanylate cyclase (GGDEF)-like protein/PAS domain S-box-containing protein
MGRKRATTILLVEDNAEEARLFRILFNLQRSHDFKMARVGSVRGAEKYLAENSIDVVLLESRLPDAMGLEAVRRVRAAEPTVAIVLLCSPGDEFLASQAIHQGAQDYLIKGQIEPRQLMRALLNAAERKSIEEALFQEKERAEVTLDCIGDAVICTDIPGNITFLNRVAETMTGWPLKEAVGRTMGEVCQILDAATRRAIVDPMANAATQNRAGELPSDCVLIRRDGHEVFIEDSVAPIRDRAGQATGAVIVFRDVTATRLLEKKLTHAAQHDSLTGLPNRALLSDRVGQAIALARRQKSQAAVLFLDLDGFKEVNDSLGHSVGDKVLQSVARRLLDCVRTPDSVSRQGGDEFVVLLQELHNPEDVAATAKRILEAVEEVHFIDHHRINVSGSIGVSVYPGDGRDVETLFKNADAAMYQAKKNGRKQCWFFGQAINARTIERESFRQECRPARNGTN